MDDQYGIEGVYCIEVCVCILRFCICFSLKKNYFYVAYGKGITYTKDSRSGKIFL